jgi:hypothetical protein
MTEETAQEGVFNQKEEKRTGEFLRDAVEGNYFYFLSAALMLLGSYMFMHASAIKGGEFVRTLKTLLILQGYEVLVIVTAVAIVTRLKVLSDAFMLFLVELVLLLDPTFFSNSFFTMRSVESSAVNVVCLALAPVKLAILLKFLRLKLSRGAWGGFLFAAAFAYLLEGPLCQVRPFSVLSRHEYYYLVAWGSLAFVAILPRVQSLAACDDTAFMPARRLVLLNRALLWIPLAIIVAHFIETSKVHVISFYALNLAPLALVAAVLLIKNTTEKETRGVLIASDFLALVGLALSYGPLNLESVQGKSLGSRIPAEPTPQFIVQHIPLLSGR